MAETLTADATMTTTTAKTKKKAKKATAPKKSGSKPKAVTGKPGKSSKSGLSAGTLRACQLAANQLKLVSDSTRIRLLDAISSGTDCVSDLCAIVEQSQPMVSHHIAILRHAGLIEPKRDGKFIRYSLSDKGVALNGLVTQIMAGSVA